MAWLKNMSLQKSFFLLTFCGLAISMLLLWLLWRGCLSLASHYPSGGIAFEVGGRITNLPNPTPQQRQMQDLLSIIPLLGCLILPCLGLAAAAAVFFRWKLKPPISALLAGTKRIQQQDLAFTIPRISNDELGQVCAAFETMRAQLLQSNRQLWQQAEERRRLNAAFAHNLRNPVTVLKGTVKLLRQGKADEQAYARLETYTNRLEQYISAMSQIQRLEQMPVQPTTVALEELRQELVETARLLAPGLDVKLQSANSGSVQLDHSLFLTVAENLINNAARFAQHQLLISLSRRDNFLQLTVTDDGPGYPDDLLQSAPKPFSKLSADAEHFGIGLYVGSLLCQKHGGSLRLTNNRQGGATACAILQLF